MTLPAGWRVVTIGEVAATALGKMLDKGRASGLPRVRYLRNVNVQWGRIDTHDLYEMELSDVDRDRFGVEPGDLLVCEGGEIGRSAIWRGDGEYIAFQKALHRIRPGAGLDPAYLRYALELAAQNGVLERHSTGSTIAHLPQQQLRQIPIALAPLDEQRRIVEILEEHLSGLDAAERALGSGRRLGEVYLRAMLHTVASDDSWSTRPLEDLARMGSGGTPRAGSDRYYRDGTIPWAVIGDLRDGPIGVTASRITTAALAESSAKIVPEGAVLLAMYGSIGKLGITQIPLATNQAIAFLVPGPDVRAGFLFWWLWGQRHNLVAAGRGGTQKNISQTVLRAWPIPQLPLEHQDRIVRVMSDAQGAATGLGAQLEALTRRASALRRALLEAAFSGQLTGRSSDLDRAEELVS